MPFDPREHVNLSAALDSDGSGQMASMLIQVDRNRRDGGRACRLVRAFSLPRDRHFTARSRLGPTAVNTAKLKTAERGALDFPSLCYARLDSFTPAGACAGSCSCAIPSAAKTHLGTGPASAYKEAAVLWLCFERSGGQG